LEHFPAAAYYQHQIQRCTSGSTRRAAIAKWVFQVRAVPNAAISISGGGKRIVLQVGHELHMRHISFDKYRDYLIADCAK
jgi:hypothetical protein